MYVNLQIKFLLCIFITLALLLIVPTASAEESTKTPIHVVFEIHSHEDRIIQSAGGSKYFEDRRDEFLLNLEHLDLMLNIVDRYDAKLTFLSVGPWAELCLDESISDECFPIIQRLYESGEMIGTHSHNYRYLGSFNQWENDREDSTGRNNWQYVRFVDLLIENALGVSDESEIRNVNMVAGMTKPSAAIPKHIMLNDFGFQMKQGGEEQVFLLYYNHIPYNPYRVGDSSLSEDLDSGLLTIAQYPIFNSKVRFDAPIDPSLEHHKAMFLQVYLNWRESDEPKIWTYGWGVHVHNLIDEADTRERIDQMLSWLSVHFIEKKSKGSVIAEYSNYRDVFDNYERWTSENPGVSSFDYPLEYTDYTKYPYNKWINQYLRNTTVVEEIILNKYTKVFLLESNGIPLVLAFSDKPETTLDLSEYFPERMDKVSLVTGLTESADPSTITIDSDAVVFCKPRDCKRILEDETGTTKFVNPLWIKEKASMWAEDRIGNIEFVRAIQFLIKAEIIAVSHSPDSVRTPIDEIFPIWVKNVADWWGNDLISDKEFVDAIEFLINERIIKL